MTLPPAGLPRDAAQWLALALALAVVLAARPLVRAGAHRRVFVILAAAVAAALSAAYVAVYLRGGPRIIDATSYYLEARALAEGFFSFPIAAPETSVLGRFLVRSEWPDGPRAAGIFPPGYPALLALGFLVRAPLAVGPCLAAALVVATFALAEGALGREQTGAVSVPRLAAGLSVACAALRYHTADTMSHGLAALCFTSALALAFRAVDAGPGRRAMALSAAAGLAAGWLFATRPASALALAPILALVFREARARDLARLGGALLAGALPGALLFFAHQHAATGAWGASSQRLYYSLADGPPDCFRYGFGEGIGCLWEHGDFVRDRLAGGYGPLAAAGTTLRRLKQHLVDPANLEPLALLVPIGAHLVRAHRRGRVLGLAIVAQIAAYVPFYFDGNYPGGGARLFADVLPIEHVLAAAAIAALAAKRAAPERWAAAGISLALAGFAFRAGFDHALLRDREGGRPMFERADLGVISRGLVFVDTDHGFDLGFDPAGSADIQVLRAHGDALDRLAWEARGRPPAYRHHFEIPPGGGPASASVAPVDFAPTAGPLIIEGESLWPPIAQRAGWAAPAFAHGTCASKGRWLALEPSSSTEPASFTVALPAGGPIGYAVTPRLALAGAVRGEVELSFDGARRHDWPFEAAPGRNWACEQLVPARVPPGARRVELTFRRVPGPAGGAALDTVELDER